MMTVYVDECPRVVSSALVFDAMIDMIDFDDPFIEALVLDVDKTQHIKGRYFESPVLGAISPKDLSGGSKSLLAVYGLKEFYSHSSSMFGNNCVEWLRQLSFMRDFGLIWTSPLWFNLGDETIPDLSTRPVSAKTVDGRPLKTCEEVWDYAIRN